MTLPAFSLLRPTQLREALEVLSEDSVPYCGGTELLLAMRAGLQRPATLVELKRIPELAGVTIQDGQLVIGATTTHMDLASDPLVTRHLPMLTEVEQTVGNARVRAQGSIGGNLCFAEPRSDVATALIALDASVSVASTDAERHLPVAEFIAGAYEADKRPDELLVDIRVPISDRPSNGVYRKHQTRERPTVGVALVRNEEHCRLVVGAVGEKPETWTFTEPDEIVPGDIADQLDPTPDLEGSVRYKRHLTAVYVRQAIDALTGRAA